MNVSNHILILLGILFFIVGSVFSQSFINNDSFNGKIAKDIVVVEFWVEWNSSNEFADIGKLKDCDIYRVDIAKESKLNKNIMLVLCLL